MLVAASPANATDGAETFLSSVIAKPQKSVPLLQLEIENRTGRNFNICFNSSIMFESSRKPGLGCFYYLFLTCWGSCLPMRLWFNLGFGIFSREDYQQPVGTVLDSAALRGDLVVLGAFAAGLFKGSSQKKKLRD